MTNKPTIVEQTANSQQLALLKKHFANCFDKHGNFIPAKLQEIVQESGVALSKEGYSLNWLGKSYARLLANENIRTRLVEDSAHNEAPANATSQNLLIKGDNLEVLKHLMGAYSEQIKMIYIDPPYNTGSDGFVYQDDRKFTVEQLSSLAGIDEDEAKRILEFTSSSSNSHSAWLTFMYPRLYLAKQLLRDDGVIFISIDDNEQAQLKVLCDEVFGEENFVGVFVWKRRASSALAERLVSTDHEYVITYQKASFTSLGNAKDFENYSNPDGDPRGDWTAGDLTVGMNKDQRPNQFYQLINPDTGISYPPNPNRVWAYIPSSMSKLVEERRVIFPVNATKRPMLKRYKNELRSEVNPASTWLTSVGLNSEATRQIQDLLGSGVFSYSKPTTLVQELVTISTKEEDIILDFFAGSGTTAHAVMQLNAEDGGNRQFICVQIDEQSDVKSAAFQAGYKSIFDITQARITKAAVKIKAEHPDYQVSLGFKVFATQPMFDKYLDEPEELTENLELFNVNALSQADHHSLLLTWALRDGIKLGAPLTPFMLGGYTAYAADKTLYFVEPGISLDAVVSLLEQLDNNPDFSPSRLVVQGYLLDSKTQREMTEAVKGYNNRKGIELTLDIRYN